MNDSRDPKYSKAKEAWRSHEAAVAYRTSRSPEQFKRFHREERILGDWLDALPNDSLVLDIPCGTGRCLPMIVGRRLKYIGADISRAMIAEARNAAQNEPHAELIQEFVIADAEHLQFASDSVDCIVMWRFLHHVRNPQIRQNILREAARVSRSKVLVSFHHAISFTNMRKSIQRILSHDRSGSPALTQWRLAAEANECGLRVVETRGFCKYVSINWFACLEKNPRAGRSDPPTG